jgi:phage tail sheath protein FI
MPTYLSPGVYVEEVQAGSRPIEGVGTAVAAFVGIAAEGPFNTPTLVTNWTQFTQTFGDFVPGAYLAQAVYGYFMNGGGACYIVRIGSDSGVAATARAELGAGVPVDGGGPARTGTLQIRALEPGQAGNEITVEVVDTTAEGAGEDAFKLIVKRGNRVEETFDNVTTKRGRQHVATVVNAQSKLICQGTRGSPHRRP